MKSKPILFFIFKATVIYALLAAPVSFYDIQYGKIYRSCSTALFGKFHHTGVASFRPSKENSVTDVGIYNTAQANADGTVKGVTSITNTRLMGYLPTVLLVALILASPISLRRRVWALAAGIVLMTGVAMLKQWICLINIAATNPWLGLTDYSDYQTRALKFFTINAVVNFGPSLFLTVMIWLLVSFRKGDLERLNAEFGISKSHSPSKKSH